MYKLFKKFTHFVVKCVRRCYNCGEMAEPFREYTRKRRNIICHIYIRQKAHVPHRSK